jgi:hypothetical protein
VIYVLERPPQGPAKRINAKELCAFLQQQAQWAQMTSQLTAEVIAPKMGWAPEQLKEYLDTPPAGREMPLFCVCNIRDVDESKNVGKHAIGRSSQEIGWM